MHHIPLGGPTSAERARRLAIILTSVLTFGAVCMVVAGYGAKPQKLAVRNVKFAAARATQKLQDAGNGMAIPDPDETARKAKEAMSKAGDSANKALSDVENALEDVLPVGDIFSALGWHLDLCFYLVTIYIVYYIWKCKVWHKVLPQLIYVRTAEEEQAVKDAEHANENWSSIGDWSEDPHDSTKPNDQDLLWFRTGTNEERLFYEKQRVQPSFIDTLMCGCGGNVYAVAVTSKRIIIQNDKRCLFGSTVLTTNEESYLLSTVHKASLHTDGALNLGICTLHSSEMLSGGFNWIFLGFLVDIVLEWKPAIMNFITDDRLKGWINLVPNDIIYMFSSVLVLFGAFLFLALLFFLICPQSTLEIEFVKQAGVSSYTKKFDFPVRTAYKMYDAIMQGRFGHSKSA
ncbi:hypothetical protein GUITHDRAFT_143064 [Guillardia theta CCMP2712]|uniref:Uncharacterized protein n=1 Tax=Guillardia theta (strain CCMP2712) TaxID=905079 RepID=L1IWA4_GUITC|nr:hypothetical protein GUITHDRAFT_143064 [Guillardia theta CCMP2712]EKX40125.1 hypothetical protein GUITHDRAFT_143064 [Guillardia theta CCMP2712]|eukprot:XP_005827105.1 hypothetical protein GUITHDRAFT_143064 [Guillardia theta CCMP2712]